MSTNVFNSTPFLRTSREFPPEVGQLSLANTKSYIDIANSINDRTIGLFAVGKPVITGEGWFEEGNKKQQTLRQLFIFDSTASITHNIPIINPNQFTRGWGAYTDGTDSFGLIYGTSVAVAGLITFYVTSTQIVFVPGGGAPVLSEGRIVLEWLSQP